MLKWLSTVVQVKKFFFKYFGPYEILDRIGGSQIHPVLHVFKLKKAVPPAQVHDSDISFLSIIDDSTLVFPCKLLGRRTIKHGRGFIIQALIAQTGLPTSLTT
jgi:hypothetical protein